MEVTCPLTSVPVFKGLGPIGFQTVPLRLIGVAPPAFRLHPIRPACSRQRPADWPVAPGPSGTSRQRREADSTARALGRITRALAGGRRESGVPRFLYARHCLYHARIC